eukprot:TRINITY_DN5842_c0_g1_i7.p1 TRINITY_DN5842_c0_g1~~TRINITY_DN5842_c0_g1_i7.p1  ORF type:complete len:166 (-),score=17.57 TRINITY_DN5842_c0_g1_i7:131-628(-)
MSASFACDAAGGTRKVASRTGDAWPFEAANVRFGAWRFFFANNEPISLAMAADAACDRTAPRIEGSPNMPHSAKSTPQKVNRKLAKRAISLLSIGRSAASMSRQETATALREALVPTHHKHDQIQSGGKTRCPRPPSLQLPHQGIRLPRKGPAPGWRGSEQWPRR